MKISTKKLLRESGWYEGRIFEIEGYKKKLKKLGCSLNEAAKEFLRSFGGLYVSHPNPRHPSSWSKFHFNAYKAAQEFSCELVKFYEHEFGIQLSVIGTDSNNYILLMMDENGKVYASMDNVLYSVGESGMEAIENICTGKKLTKIT